LLACERATALPAALHTLTQSRRERDGASVADFTTHDQGGGTIRLLLELIAHLPDAELRLNHEAAEEVEEHLVPTPYGQRG
jgi:hypothetical protein